MKRLLSAIVISAIVNISAFSVGIGFYVPDRPDYMTDEGRVYSTTENNAASDIYPIGTIVNISGKNGAEESVYINDRYEMPPDREILLNTAAAERLGILECGYDELSLSVILEGEENREENQGWYKYLVSMEDTNEEAFKLYRTLQENGLRAYASAADDGIMVYVRYVPQYQTSSVENLLSSLGYAESVQMDEENPYL